MLQKIILILLLFNFINSYIFNALYLNSKAIYCLNKLIIELFWTRFFKIYIYSKFCLCNCVFTLLNSIYKFVTIFLICNCSSNLREKFRYNSIRYLKRAIDIFVKFFLIVANVDLIKVETKCNNILVCLFEILFD